MLGFGSEVGGSDGVSKDPENKTNVIVNWLYPFVEGGAPKQNESIEIPVDENPPNVTTPS